MGNKSTRHRDCIEEIYTRPQGSYVCQDGDYRKLRRLILNGQLAPCYPGAEEFAPELDECPICFMFYPSLNRSTCCSKSVCTECYLQIKSTGCSPLINCPFCKTPNYMVEYRGAKTAQEKDFEQAEEQKVIEAKIRMHQKELNDQEERLRRRGVEGIRADELDVASARGGTLHSHGYDVRHADQFQEPFEHDEIELFERHDSEDENYEGASFRHSSGDDEISLDMDEVMLMKAIWLSIQEQGEISRESAIAQQTLSSNPTTEVGLRRRAGGRCSGSGGLAETRGGRVASGSQSYLEHANHSSIASVNSRDLLTRSSTIQVPRRYSGSVKALVEGEDADWGKCRFYSQTQRGSYEEMEDLSTTTASMIPESFDEQVMLAMALSLADEEAQARYGNEHR